MVPTGTFVYHISDVILSYGVLEAVSLHLNGQESGAFRPCLCAVAPKSLPMTPYEMLQNFRSYSSQSWQYRLLTENSLVWMPIDLLLNSPSQVFLVDTHI